MHTIHITEMNTNLSLLVQKRDVVRWVIFHPILDKWQVHTTMSEGCGGHFAGMLWAHLSPKRGQSLQINIKLSWLITFVLWWIISILSGIFQNDNALITERFDDV